MSWLRRASNLAAPFGRPDRFKWLFFAFVLCAFPIFVSAEDAPVKNLLENEEFRSHWYALLHYRGDGENRTITDPTFYAASSGNDLPTPREELQVIWRYLDKGEGELYCQFPARSALIKREGEGFYDLPDISVACSSEVNDRVDQTDPLLGFASASDASLASVFGHIFLVVEPASGRLSASTIEYAAQIGGNGERGDHQAIDWKDAYRGLTGDLSGTYSKAPLHERLRVYNREQQRNVWLYELALSTEEQRLLHWHLDELQGVKIPYRFLSHNCGYGALAVIDAVLGTNLRKELNGVVAPQSVLRKFDKRGLLELKRVELATDQKIDILRSQLRRELVETIDSCLSQGRYPSVEWLEDNPRAAELLYLEIKRQHFQKEPHWEALKQLGPYGTREVDWREPTKHARDPRYAQPYRYIGVGVQSFYSDDNGLLISFSPGYKGPLARPRGYPKGYGVQLFSGSIRIDKHNDVHLQQLDFVHFENLAGKRTAYGDRATEARLQLVHRRHGSSRMRSADRDNVLEALFGAGLSHRAGTLRMAGLIDGLFVTNFSGGEGLVPYVYAGPHIKMTWESLNWHARVSASHRFALHSPVAYRQTLRVQGAWYPTERLGLIIQAERLQGFYRERRTQAELRFHF